MSPADGEGGHVSRMTAAAATAADDGARNSVTPNWLLFVFPCIIWGSTWLVIKYQYGIVPPEASVAYRFLAASLILFAWCGWRGEPLGFTGSQHVLLAMTGGLQFAINYVFVYLAEQYLTSGLVAVVFALMVIWNLLGARFLFGQTLSAALLIGATCGLVGVALVFWPEVAGVRGDVAQIKGLVFALLGTLGASAGNLATQRLYAQKIPVLPCTAWGMLYGSIGTLLYCVAFGIPLVWDSSIGYLVSLVYLTIVGSVVAFGMYLTLLKRIGAGRSGYTSAVIPVLAMLLSTFFEDYVWTPPALAGMLLVMIGNVLVLRRR